jgi:hypothetical protein
MVNAEVRGVQRLPLFGRIGAEKVGIGWCVGGSGEGSEYEEQEEAYGFEFHNRTSLAVVS